MKRKATARLYPEEGSVCLWETSLCCSLQVQWRQEKVQKLSVGRKKTRQLRQIRRNKLILQVRAGPLQWLFSIICHRSAEDSRSSERWFHLQK